MVRIGAVGLVVVLALLALTPLRATGYDLHMSPLNFTEADPLLTIVPYGIQYQAIKVTSASPGTNRMIVLGLPLPSDVVIDAITICYENPNALNFISAIRLTSMTTPNTFTILHDDPTNLNAVGAHCSRSEVGGDAVTGTITLTLDIDYAQSNASVYIGGITLHLSPAASAMEEEGLDVPRRPVNVGAWPSPSTEPVSIAYSLDRGGRIDVHVCDVTGRALKTLFRGDQEAGEHNALWDLSDDAGRTVPSGTYYLVVRKDGEAAARSVVVLR